MRDSRTIDPFVEEVLELHEFLEGWLKGEIRREEGLDRLRSALADDFVIIHPSGTRAGKHEVIQSFAAAYHSKGSRYALAISDIHGRSIDRATSLVTYREDHESEDGRARISTALLQRRDDRVTWLFLPETSISE